MAERAHPDDPGFQYGLRVRLRRGIIPWIYYKNKSPYRLEFEWRYSWVNQYCSGCDVVDVPYGMGWGTSLMENCKTLTGVDIDQYSVAEAKRRYGKKAAFYVANMTKLPFSDQSIDRVVCLEGIEHVSVEDGNKFLAEAHRILKINGRLLISTPHCVTKPHSGNPYHQHEYTYDEITKTLMDNGYGIEEVVARSADIMQIHYMCCIKRANSVRANSIVKINMCLS